MARLSPALARYAVDAACQTLRGVFPRLEDGHLLAVQLQGEPEPWLLHACADTDGDVFALQMMAGADALSRLHAALDRQRELRGRMLLVAFVPRANVVQRLSEVVDTAKFTENLVPCFTVIDDHALPRVPDAKTLRQIVAILRVLVRGAEASRLPAVVWRRSGGASVAVLQPGPTADSPPTVLPEQWFEAPMDVPPLDPATMLVGDEVWRAQVVGRESGTSAPENRRLMLVVQADPDRYHCAFPIDAGSDLVAVAREALVYRASRNDELPESEAQPVPQRLPRRIACADESLRAAFAAALGAQVDRVQLVVDPAVRLFAGWAERGEAVAHCAELPAQVPADGDVAAWRIVLRALMLAVDPGQDRITRAVRARFLGEGALCSREFDLPDALVTAFELYYLLFDRPHRGRLTAAERIAQQPAATSVAMKAWLAALVAGQLGLWCCEQHDGERCVVREAASDRRFERVARKAVGVPGAGRAVGGLRVELAGLTWFFALTPELATSDLCAAVEGASGGRRLDAELLRQEVAALGRVWERAGDEVR
jgi:hypothetical protein